MTSRTEALHDEYYRREGREVGKFRYLRPDGSEVEDPADLARFARLAVPPAWEDVYVSPDADHELQAFGRDSAGRLQYRYHPGFLEGNAQRKWQRLVRFARQLPDLRANTGRDLRLPDTPPRKVMAIMTRLLYVAHFRVGSDEYARANRTYGLSTLRKRHVRVLGSTVEFDFRGKHGIRQHKATTDRTIANNVERLLGLPGPWLFQAVAEGGRCRIRSGDLNAYIREVAGPFTAKDFRTWGGTLAAAEFLAELGPAATQREAKKALVECVKHVAEDLGNTPAVVRSHYISPYVFDQYLAGHVLDEFEPRSTRTRADSAPGLTRSEHALLRMLEVSARQARGAERRAA